MIYITRILNSKGTFNLYLNINLNLNLNRNLNLNLNLNISLNIKIDEFSFIYRFFIVLLETMKETNFFISKRL